MLEKQNLLGLTQSKFKDFFSDLSEKPFRTKQIMQWIYHQGVHDFGDMHNFSKDLRDKLGSIASLDLPEVVSMNNSKDGVVKWVIKLGKDNHIETVYIPQKDRGTLCISSQVGCSLACTFCSTGHQGFNRNLKAHEIIGQVLVAKNHLVQENKRISNVVFMGMGEPLLNYENLLKSIELVSSKTGLSMSPKRITVSTAGIAKMIKKLADDDVRFNLAISLHTSDDKKREEIMPINKSINLEELKESIKYFFEKTGTRITYEYILFKDINDSLDDAHELVKFCKSTPCKVNLIEYNSVDNIPFQKASNNKTEKFINFLNEKNVIVNLRRSKGKDINAACGQLVNKLK